MRPYHYPAYWYNPYIPMIKYADTSWWQNATPYLQSAGIGAGIGALGGAGISALRGGDWKKALKSALVGMVAGAVAGPAVYAGYSRLFPGQTAPSAPTGGQETAQYVIEPRLVTPEVALSIIRTNDTANAIWNAIGRRTEPEALQFVFQKANLPYLVEK